MSPGNPDNGVYFGLLDEVRTDTGEPLDGTNYESSNPDVADCSTDGGRVDPSEDNYCTVVGYSDGEATITVYSDADRSQFAELRVTVEGKYTPPTVTDVEIIGIENAVGNVNCNDNYSACTMSPGDPDNGVYFGLLDEVRTDTGEPLDGTNYESSNPDVADCSTDGGRVDPSEDNYCTVVGYSDGEATITVYSDADRSQFAELRVTVEGKYTPPTVTDVEIIGIENAVGNVNCNDNYSACTMSPGNPDNGVYFGLLDEVRTDTGEPLDGTNYESSNPDVADCSTDGGRVDPSEDNYCTVVGYSDGEATITVYSDADRSQFAELRITVEGR
ncbi:MAG: hypothetical protein U5L04_08390 [Trueperaceae bacterium]|nr:hypothetical protein [Trueperaceae bacterium]